MNWTERIAKMFYAPREVFSYISDRPDWFIPLIIYVGVSILGVSLIFSPIIRPAQIEKIEESSRLTPEQTEEIKSRLEGNLPFIMTMVGTLVVTPLGLIIVSAIFYGVFSLMGGGGKFKQVFSVCSYSSLIAALGVIVKTPLQLAKGSSDVYTSAALVAPGISPGSALFRLLNNFDIFTLWQLWVMIIGLGIVYNFSTKKSMIGVLSLWAAWVVLSVVVGGIFKG